MQFPLLITGSSLLLAFFVLLTLLIVNIHFGDRARETLLAKIIGQTAIVAAESVEMRVNLSIRQLRGAANLLGAAPPFAPNGSDPSGWSVSSAAAAHSCINRMTVQTSLLYLDPVNGAERTLIELRGADGTGGALQVAPAPDESVLSAAVYREDPGGGIWDGVDEPTRQTAVLSFGGYNWSTLESSTFRVFYNAAWKRRSTTRGALWNWTLQLITGHSPSVEKKDPRWRMPTFGKQADSAWVYRLPYMKLDARTRQPLVMAATFLNIKWFDGYLQKSLRQLRFGSAVHLSVTSNKSFAFLVDRRHGITLSQSSGQLTFVEDDLGKSLDPSAARCTLSNSGRYVSCFKNLSGTPDYVLLRDLLLAGNSSLHGEALDDALASPKQPMLSDPDRGGDTALNIITGSEDGVEYYAIVRTLSLPAEQDLKLSIIAFTPRDLFAGEAIRGRNASIGVAVSVAFVVIVVQTLLLYSVSSAVSELADKMSDPLALLQPLSVLLADDGAPPPPPVSANSTHKSFRARVLSSFSSLIEIREIEELQQSFDLTLGRIKELRGFVSKTNMDFLVGANSNGNLTGGTSQSSGSDNVVAPAAEEEGPGAGGEAVPLPPGASDAATIANIPSAAAAAAAAAAAILGGGESIHEDDDAAEVEGRRPVLAPKRKVRFTLEENGANNRAQLQQEESDTSTDSYRGRVGGVFTFLKTAAAAAAPRYPLEKMRAVPTRRFCVVTISFPFVQILRDRIFKIHSESSSAADNNSAVGGNDDTAAEPSSFVFADVLFDAVNLAARAASCILAHGHLTSIEDLCTVGDETMCCFRLRSPSSSSSRGGGGGVRSKFLLRILKKCVSVSFKLLHATREMIRYRIVAAAAATGSTIRAQKEALNIRPHLTLFLAAGFASGEARVSFLHPQHVSSSSCSSCSSSNSGNSSSDTNSSSSSHQGSLSIFSSAVARSVEIVRSLTGGCNTLIYDHQEYNLLLKNAPCVRCPAHLCSSPPPREGKSYRCVFAVPFLIGLPASLRRAVEPDFSPVESFSSPALWKRKLERCLRSDQSSATSKRAQAPSFKRQFLLEGNVAPTPRNPKQQPEQEEEEPGGRIGFAATLKGWSPTRRQEELEIMRVAPVEMSDFATRDAILSDDDVLWERPADSST